MQARRRLVATLGASVALVGLTGCQKPTPIVSAVSPSFAKKAIVGTPAGSVNAEDSRGRLRPL